MIDLSQYIDKEVKVTRQDGSIHTGKFSWYIKFNNEFVFITNDQNNYLYRKGGEHFFTAYCNIVKIELINPEKPKQMPTNALESTTLNTIATALAPAAIKYVESHEKYAEVMQSLIIEFVEKNLGDVNGDLPFMIFDRMYLARGRD